MVPYYPPHVGGLEFFVQSLSQHLIEREHDVTVFTSSDKDISYHEEINGVKIYRLKALTKVYNVPIAASLFGKLLREKEPDIVHAHQYPVFFSDMSALATRFRHLAFLLHIHVISEPKSIFSHFVSSLYYETVGKFTLETAKAVITPSLAYKSELTKMKVESNKIRVIPYGIDLTKFNSENDGDTFKKRYDCDASSIILSVGRLNYQKGLKYLLKAMRIVMQQVPDVKLVIVGNGEQLTSLRDLSQSLGLENSVIFTGAIPQMEIPEAYAAADVFVLPSIFESFGIALIEAQASGKPVIGTRVGGAPEALQENRTGFLVNPADSKQLGEAIIRVLSDKKLARQMGENGRNFVKERFDVQKIVDRITSVYDELAANPLQNKSG